MLPPSLPALADVRRVHVYFFLHAPRVMWIQGSRSKRFFLEANSVRGNFMPRIRGSRSKSFFFGQVYTWHQKSDQIAFAENHFGLAKDFELTLCPAKKTENLATCSESQTIPKQPPTGSRLAARAASALPPSQSPP